MRAVTYQGKEKMTVTTVPDPKIQEPTDAIIRVTATAICGSDLHLYHNGNMVLNDDYVVGHEPMGIVEEVGPDVKNLKVGDRIVVPFNVSCGHCHFCENDMESQCDESNRNPETDYGGLFGFGKLNGDYPGGQAEFLRVPYADQTSFKVPDNHIADEKVLFLSDIVPTAYWSVEHAGVKPGDTVIVLGSGPVGLLAQRFAKMKGAKRVIAVDRVKHRLEYSAKKIGVETLNFEEVDIPGMALKDMTHGGADVVIDCVGMDGKQRKLEKVTNLITPQMGTTSPIEMASMAVKKFGTIMLTGVYLTPATNFPINHIFARNVTLKSGQTPVPHLMPKLYEMIKNNEFDPSDIITHTMPLEDAAKGYEIFDKKEDNNIKVVLKP
ncbi:zinc-dependent alcohol dehydrogenase [Marinilactibacillus sp. Marseille-P9653]|uniref:zinc-dependent alcohol dehydrogenase n=1 Tax=Marinilactibacillus sp. Marseille-P9653 TaxID=2866583 RepID=UPI001CE48DB2|nr:zinc-dependent alcohol dehydrogenase [Marinilactibacillus sp. Marseille-P9653]